MKVKKLSEIQSVIEESAFNKLYTLLEVYDEI